MTPASLPPLKKGDHVFLIDGSSFVFRAYFAMFKAAQSRGKSFTRSDGLPIGGVLTFCNMLWKILREGLNNVKPTHLAVVFDYSGKSFRNEIYDDYKGHRPEPPDELIPQFPLMREAVRAFGLIPIEQEGFEADDLIATYSRLAGQTGADVTIVAGDKDLMQLVRPGIVMYDPMPGNERRIGRDEVITRFGVPPEKVPEVQALIGDPTDNVPGVPGIGPKAASTLINEVGSLEKLLAAATPQKIEDELKKKLTELQSTLDEMAGQPVKINSASSIEKVLKEKFATLPSNKKADAQTIEQLANEGNEFCKVLLRARNLSRVIGSALSKVFQHKDLAAVSKQLVLLDDHVELACPLDDLRLHEPNAATLVAFLKAMEFNTLTRRVAEALSADANEIEADPRLRPDGGAAGQAHEGEDEMPAVTAAQAAAPQAPAEKTSRTRQTELPLGGPLAPARPATTAGTRSAGKAGPQSGPFTPQDLVAARVAEAAGTTIDRGRYPTITDRDTLALWIDAAHGQNLVAIDLIASAPDPMVAEIIGVALALGPDHAGYVPLGHRASGDLLAGGGLLPDQISLQEALAQLKPLLESAGIVKIGHDLKADMHVLARYGITLAGFDDVQLLSYVLDAGTGAHTLGALAQRHLHHTALELAEIVGKGRTLVPFAQVEIARALLYGAEQADLALRLWRLFKARLVAEHMTTVYETLERPLIPVLMRMERRGIAIDRQVLSRLSGDFAQKAAALEHEAQEIAGEPFNLGSPKQIGDILFGKFKLPGARKTKTGAWSTSASVLDDLAEEGHPLPVKILEWRQLTKLKSTYTDQLPTHINPTTGRVHTSYALAATTTGRLASAEPNLQNIPVRTEEGRKIRRAFIAQPGMKLVSADYSQIELRLLAEIADIVPLKQAFRDGLDIHAMTASEMFGVPVAGMPGEVRRRAKAINFGIIYGISAFGLANQLGIPREEAGAYIKRYFERFPGIRDYMEASKAFCRTHGYVETLFGRKCHYPDIRASNPSLRAFNERAAINARLQGSAADIIRRAMVRMEPALAEQKLAAQMLLQVHDELVFELPENEVAATLPVITRVMEEAPMPAVPLSVPLHVDARAADNWDAAH